MDHTIKVLKPRGSADFQDSHGVERTPGGQLHVVVADGHGPSGDVASKVAVQTILDAIGGQADFLRIRAAFLVAHQLVSSAADKGGTTATFACVDGATLLTAWVGNSEARIVRRDGTLHTLAIPHEFGRHRQETSRLRRAGADIVSRHSAAMWGRDDEQTHVMPKKGRVRVGNVSLEVTRALGDREFDPFVLHEPEMRETAISDGDRFLIVGSDGFWQPVTRRTSKRHLIERVLAGSSDVKDARDRMVDQLVKWKLDDDVTIVIVDLHA